MLPLYGGADFAIPFPPVCGSADNPPPVLSAKISASVLFRSYSTSPFGNRIWRKKTAHTIKNLPFKNPKPFPRDSVPYPDRGMWSKYLPFGKTATPPPYLGGTHTPVPPFAETFHVSAVSGSKGVTPLAEFEIRTAEQMRRLPEGQGLKTLLEQSLKKIKYSSCRSRSFSAGNHCRANPSSPLPKAVNKWASQAVSAYHSVRWSQCA